jgi:hypothetical protein
VVIIEHFVEIRREAECWGIFPVLQRLKILD